MADSKVKVEYIAVPFEDPEKTSGSKKMEGETLSNNDNLPIYFVNDTTHDCYFKRSYEKRKALSKVLILILLVFLASKILFGWLAFSATNELDDEDQYLWIETQETSSNNDIESSLLYPPWFSIASKCEPMIRWEGPSEILIDRKNTSGLIFKIKGRLAHGSVIIRQDPQEKDYINVTNHIYLGDESLQEKVDIRISYLDEDYMIIVETPSLHFPPNEKYCIRVDTIITIPHTVKVFRSLSVNVPNSWITTDSLGTIDFAYVNLKTTNGHISVDGLAVANAGVSTVNGLVSGTFIIGESLEARSISGDISINAIPNPRFVNIFVGVSSVSGNLNIEVNELMEDHKIDLKGRTVNGGIIATVPEIYKGNFLVSSIMKYAYVEGEGITFRRNTLRLKEGYKSDDDKSVTIKKHNCKHELKQSFNSLHDSNNSNLTLASVTGASELYFV